MKYKKKSKKRLAVIFGIVLIIVSTFSVYINSIALSTVGNKDSLENSKLVQTHTTTAADAGEQNRETSTAIDLEKTTMPIITENSIIEVTKAVGNLAIPTENRNDYTDDDLYYLAAAVCREAGGATEEIQLLVANVIINRVNSSLYPNTIYEVLTQYKQYGTMWKYGVSFPNWANEEVKSQCYSVAKRILEGERYCPENVLFQAEFEQGRGVFKQFDDTYYFCYY